MAWAKDLKNLAATIKTSHGDRATQIRGIKKDTQDILSDADAFMKKTAVDLKAAAKDLRDFLAKSEETRKKDFAALLNAIQTKVKDIKKYTKAFLEKSEETRKKDFNALIKVVRGTVKDIKDSTADLLGQYNKEMKELADDLKESAAHLKTFLKGCEEKRIADFKGLMRDIATVIGDIVADVKIIRKSTSHLMADYHAERKEAAGYWAGLSGKTKAHQVKKHKE